MNNKLTYEIAKHILNNLVASNLDYSKSIKDNSFLLNEKLPFDDDTSSNIWGCQSNTDSGIITILFSDLSINDDIEYCLLVNVENLPTYGIFYSLNSEDVVIACSVENNMWFACNVHLQATFLAAMESFRDINFIWKKSENYKNQLHSMLSFVKYYQSFIEEENEGEKERF